MSETDFHHFLKYAAGFLAVLGIANLWQNRAKGKPSLPFSLACFTLAGVCFFTSISSPIKWVFAAFTAICFILDVRQRQGVKP